MSTEALKLNDDYGSTNKVRPRWAGPFPVTKATATNVTVDLPGSVSQHNVIHVSKTKPLREPARVPRDQEQSTRPLPAQGAPRSRARGAAAGAMYPVEALLERRHNGRRIEFLVKWQGWSSAYNTWEPQSNLKADLGEDWPTFLESFNTRLTDSAQSAPSASAAAPSAAPSFPSSE